MKPGPARCKRYREIVSALVSLNKHKADEMHLVDVTCTRHATPAYLPTASSVR